MKLACIGTGWYPNDPGGLEKYVYGMTRALLQGGDSLDLFLTGNGVLDDHRARIYSIGNPGEPLWKRLLDARRTFATRFREPYDAINIHFAMNALPLLPFIDHRTPRIVHFHGPWAAEGRIEGGSRTATAVKEFLERFVYRRSDRFIVLSGAFKTLLVGYGVDAARVSVIPMGIDCDFFQPALDRSRLRRELGWADGSTVFFTARRLINRVGLVELLKATQLLRAQHANFSVKIAGKGPLRAELERAIDTLGLGDCVELLGFVSEHDLVRHFQAADVTVLPTQSLEGFGTIISESLACGTPVLVTPVGGMPEAVFPLSPELIARSASPEDISERMGAILHGTLNLPSPEACRTYAEETFDWPVVWKKVRSVFLTA